MGKMTLSDMYCTQCGQKNIPIPRKISKEREAGHLKKMYCVHCKQEVNMVEIRPFGLTYTFEDFLLEYNYHNFDSTGQRVKSFKEFKRELIKQGDDINE